MKQWNGVVQHQEWIENRNRRWFIDWGQSVPIPWRMTTGSCAAVWPTTMTYRVENKFEAIIKSISSRAWRINCIHISLSLDSFFYWCIWDRPVSVSSYTLHSCIYLRILIISYLATFLGTNTNSLSVLISRKAVNQSINSFSSQCSFNMLGLSVYQSRLLL